MAQANLEHQLDAALAEFHGKLTAEEKNRFQALRSVPDVSSVMTFTAQLDQAGAKRGGRCLASRLSTLLASVQQFSSVVGTFVQSNPEVAALVWGSVKFMLLLANRSFEYFDKLSFFLMRIGKYCPRFVEYQSIFHSSPRVQSALCSFYTEIVRCCTHVCEVFRKPDWRTLVRSAWRPFEAEFGQFRDHLEQLANNVKEEIQLADVKAASDERHEQEAHRGEVVRFLRRNQKELSTARKHKLARVQRERLSERQRLLNRLCGYDHETAYRQARLKCHTGTAEWLTASSDYKDWMSAKRCAVFCVSGKLGCGKTILMSNIVSHLFADCTDSSVQKTFFFCRYDDQASLCASTIVRSIIRQCLDPQSLSNDIESSISQLLRQPMIEAEDLQNLLDLSIPLSKEHYIIIDGLEECPEQERQPFLHIISGAMRTPSVLVKLMLSCRNTTSLRDLLPPDCVFDATMDLPAVQDDIAVFLWAVLQIQEICRQTCDDDIRKVVKNLPKTLEETCLRMLGRIVEGQKCNLARRIFIHVAAVKRPLSLYELQEAVAVEKYAQSSRPEQFVNDVSRIVPWCEGLLVLEEVNEEVHFAHPSVREALTSKQTLNDQAWAQFSLQDADTEVGVVCATYLNFSDFERQLVKRNNPPNIRPEDIVKTTMASHLNRRGLESLLKLGQLRSQKPNRQLNVMRQLTQLHPNREKLAKAAIGQQFPYLAYASQHWLAHSTKFRKDDRIWHLWLKLLSSDSKLARRPWPDEDWQWRNRSLCGYIVHNNHTALASAIISSSAPFSSERLTWILCSAAAIGQIDVVRCILDHAGAGVVAIALSWEDKQRTALVHAIRGGHFEVAELLLAANADVNAIASQGCPTRTSLQAAAEGGHLELVQRLLAMNADVNAPAIGFSGRTALQAAAGGGHLEVVDRLLTAGADIDACACEAAGRTALQAAAGGGHLGVVEKLLRAQANVNSPSSPSSGRTALQAAAENGGYEVVDRLLHAGANVNAPAISESGRTALQAAAAKGHLEVVERLLHAGAVVNAPGAVDGGRTALQAAAEGGQLGTVRKLFQAGADVNAPACGGYGRTALQAAARRGHLGIVKFLIAAGADVHALGFYADREETALDAATVWRRQISDNSQPRS